MRLCNPVTFGIGWLLAVALVAAVLLGCEPKPKPVPPSHTTATADGLGGAKADAATIGGIFDAFTLSIAPPLLPLAHMGTLATLDLKQRLTEAATANELTQANAASLYADAIHWKEKDKADVAAGEAALKAERGHFWSYQQRIYWKIIIGLGIAAVVVMDFLPAGFMRGLPRMLVGGVIGMFRKPA